MTEIQKIKDLFNSSDTSNHKLAYILAKSQLGMNDKEICYMILNDGDGWISDRYRNDYEFRFVKYIFNGKAFYFKHVYSQDVMLKLELLNHIHMSVQLNYIERHWIRIVTFKLNDWFSKLDK